jgi:hypothetical protein
MGFTLWNLLKAGLLMTNAIAVLHPKRFLRKCECTHRPMARNVLTSVRANFEGITSTGEHA